MPFKKFLKRFHKASENTAEVAGVGVGAILRDPGIMAYPVLATIFVLLTYSAVSGAILGLWHHVEPQAATSAIGSVQATVPHSLRDKIGIVSFYYFYTAVVTTYFTVAAAAAVLAKLEGHPTTVLHGLIVVAKHFGRITRFALLSIFYIPLGIFAQRRKLPGGLVGVVGSSATLHSANLAPSILDEKTSVTATVRRSVNTLGNAWREGIIIKVAMWTSLLVLATISFIPNLVRSYWFDGSTSHVVGWLTSTVFAFTFFVLTKVIGGVLLTVLYYQAKHRPEKFN